MNSLHGTDVLKYLSDALAEFYISGNGTVLDASCTISLEKLFSKFFACNT